MEWSIFLCVYFAFRCVPSWCSLSGSFLVYVDDILVLLQTSGLGWLSVTDILVLKYVQMTLF